MTRCAGPIFEGWKGRLLGGWTGRGKVLSVFGVVALLCVVYGGAALALENPGEVLNKEVGVFTELGRSVDLELPFTDENGERRALRELITPDKPVIVVPVYYRCPRLCGLVQEGVIQLIKGLDLQLGKDYSVVAISFDPREGAEDAKKAFDILSVRLKSEVGDGLSGYHTVVGESPSVTAVMDQLGFKYKQEGADFAHSAAVMVLTPTGKISQYFTGIQFNPFDVHLSLVDASQGHVGSAIDHLLLYCFRFDSIQGRYIWAVEAVLRIGGALTLVVLGAVYLLMRYRRLGKSAG